MLDKNDFWRHIINNLAIEHELRETDDEELEEEITQIKESNSELLLKDAAVIRLQMDIYLISPTEGGKKAYMVNGNQLLEDCGVMTIQEALTMIKSRNKKKS